MRSRTVLALAALAALPGAPAASAPFARGNTLVFASTRAAEIVRPAVYTIGIDGRDRRRITPKWRNVTSPRWSPTGRWIAFERDYARSYVVSARGGRPILLKGRVATERPIWSPDGSAIALRSPRDETADLLVAKTWHWRARRLVRDMQVGPAWLPDGRSLAYTTGGREIRLVNVNTGARRILYTALRPPNDIALSPDGTLLAYSYVSPADEIYDLYLADLRTGRQRRIARGLAYPAWSPDGRHLAVRTGGDVNDVYVLSRDGRKRIRVAKDDYDETREPPVWSPDGRRLLITRGEVYAIRIDGHGRTQITHNFPRFELPFDDEASWSPTGARVAYVSEKREPSDSDLYEVDARGGAAYALTRNWIDESGPAWSPDGSTLAFARTVRRLSSVALLRPGGHAMILASGTSPAWSPDGSRLAFERDGDVFVMSTAGTDVHAVTSGPAKDSEPDWSPDGGRIAFARELPDGKDIWTVAADGSGLVRVTDVQGGRNRCTVFLASSPAWSPDGSEIAYSLLDGGNLSCGLHGAWESINAVSTDGSRRTRLITDGGRTDPTNGEGAYEPAWSPDGTEIAFRDVLQERDRIAIVPSAGGRLRFSTPRSYEAMSPDWRPR